MSEFRVTSFGDLGQLLCNYRDAMARLDPPKAVFEHGPFAVDALGMAMAEELLAALRGLLSEADAKTVVGILLENGLTLDHTLDGSID